MVARSQVGQGTWERLIDGHGVSKWGDGKSSGSREC